MKSKSRICLLLVVTGFIILILPDNGKRVVEFNQRHGPSFTDLIGLLMILTAWGYSLSLIIQNWRKIAGNFAKPNIVLALTLYFLSLALILISLLLSTEVLLWSAVVVASIINLLFAFWAVRTHDK